MRKTAAGTLTCAFTAHTLVGVQTQLSVSVTDARYGLDDTPIAGSPSTVATVNAAAAANTSTLLLDATQEVGRVAYGVIPYDEFGNACTVGRPAAFTAYAAMRADDSDGTVFVGAAKDERYRGPTSDLAIDLSETVALPDITAPVRRSTPPSPPSLVLRAVCHQPVYHQCTPNRLLRRRLSKGFLSPANPLSPNARHLFTPPGRVRATSLPAREAAARARGVARERDGASRRHQR